MIKGAIKLNTCFFILSFLIIGLSACFEIQNSSKDVSSADWILTNGKILTVDDDFTKVEAMAIKDSLIIGTGSTQEIMSHAGSATKITDLQGKTVIPGLIDNHMHFVRAAKHWYRMVRWDNIKSRKEALEMVKNRAKNLPEDEWVIVIGSFIFDQFQDNSTLFTINELDSILPNRPLYIQEGYSRAFVNTAALKAAGLYSNPKLIKGIVKNKGMLKGRTQAMKIVSNAIPEPSQEVWDNSLTTTMNSLLGMGLTTIYDVGGNTVTPSFYESVKRFAINEALKMRVFYSLNEQNSASDSAEEIINELKTNSPNLIDLQFAQFGYGETVYRPMRANPFEVSKENQNHFKNIIIAAIENDWQIHEHSLRDVKVQLLLDILEEIAVTHPQMSNLRFTIAHTNGMSNESIKRAIDLDMVFAVHSSSRQMSKMKYESGAKQPPAKSINELGGIWGLGSDGTTVASPNPFHTIGWLVSGRNIAGEKYLTQTVGREDALRAHTSTNAYLLFREEHLGSLEKGKRADFAVLNKNYMTVPEEDIQDLYSIMTILNGKVVYNLNEDVNN